MTLHCMQDCLFYFSSLQMIPSSATHVMCLLYPDVFIIVYGKEGDTGKVNLDNPMKK